MNFEQAPTSAYAFRAEVAKWLALVRLLLSDVPERTELTAPGLATALGPYFQLSNAVRVGDLNAFAWVFGPLGFTHWLWGDLLTLKASRLVSSSRAAPADVFTRHRHANLAHAQGAAPHSNCVVKTPVSSSPVLNQFRHREVAERHRGVWARDRVANLVVRLRQNVLRAGLARMGAAYSRISLPDVAAKLGVASAADAESIIAKVIRCVFISSTLLRAFEHESGN